MNPEIQSWDEFFARLEVYEKLNPPVMSKETVRESVLLGRWVNEAVKVPEMYSNPAIETRIELKRRIRAADARLE